MFLPLHEKYDEYLSFPVMLHVCASQFCSKHVFSLMTRSDRSYNCNWYYNECRHGKGSVNELSGTVKNKLFRNVSGNSDKVKIVNTEGFAKDTDETKGIKSLYMPEAAIESKPKDVKEDCYIKETLQIQKVV